MSLLLYKYYYKKYALNSVYSLVFDFELKIKQKNYIKINFCCNFMQKIDFCIFFAFLSCSVSD
jgi:hypothetical protein